MPRTKVKKTRLTDSVKPNVNKLHNDIMKGFKEQAKKNLKLQMQKYENMAVEMQRKVRATVKELPLKFNSKPGLTMAELKLNLSEAESIYKSVSSTKSSLMSSTMGSTHRARNAKYGSSSNLKDKSRAQPNISKPKTRLSRSLSRSKMQQSVANSYTTPMNSKLPLNSFGVVTPKVKPNTPQIMLRRPKQGEMAISMQGSPLLVTVTNDQTANVNIPLLDGRIISIQPQRGLRMSQIPDFDPETQRQLQTLRDNLNKVCALSTYR